MESEIAIDDLENVELTNIVEHSLNDKNLMKNFQVVVKILKDQKNALEK